MGMTISEKIMARASGKSSVRAGDYVVAEPDLVIICDATWPLVVRELRELEVEEIPHPERLFLVVDHTAQAAQFPAGVGIHKSMRRFAAQHGVRHFYDVGQQGIRHQVVMEQGMSRPGWLASADEPNLSALGAVGCLAIGIATEVYAAVVTGENWFRVPGTIRIHVEGELPRGVMARDLAMQVAADLREDGAIHQVLEYYGPGIDRMSIDGRMAICNQAYAAGATSAIIIPDEVALEYIRARADEGFEVVGSDPDAEYTAHLSYNLSDLVPRIVLPPKVDNSVPIGQMAGERIDQAFLGSCASGRMEDLRAAAEILRGRRVAPNVRFYVVPISQKVYAQAAREGLLEVFAEAGAVVLSSGCQVCTGYVGALDVGDVCIASSTVNYPGRMGSEEATIYLANPASVAAAAVAGRIVDPREALA